MEIRLSTPTRATENIMATSRNHDSSDSAFGVGSSLSDSHVHYTLLVACVLVAFSLGAILSGFLVSCYCRGPAHRAAPLAKDPEASLPQALSLRSLAKLNGLLEHSSKERLDVSRLYSSLVNGSEPQLNLDPPAGGAAELSLSQTQSDADFESTLPTPESSPDLERSRSPEQEAEQSDPAPSGHAPSGHAPSAPGFVAFVGNSSVFQSAACKSDSVLTNGTTLGTAQFRPANQEPASLHQSQSSLPQVDVSALDELLRHIHECFWNRRNQSSDVDFFVWSLPCDASEPPTPAPPAAPRPAPPTAPPPAPPTATQTSPSSTTTRTHHYTPRAQDASSILGPKLLEPPLSSKRSTGHAPERPAPEGRGHAPEGRGHAPGSSSKWAELRETPASVSLGF
ncbi:hypothetical protein WMY93_033430 [Mugilogobius chulae]|uniref:Uncharacterized protein n=1 Tax=Mugilogobius chulae TaxID=88201 RepID=A0AAW0ML65_9GOBI